MLLSLMLIGCGNTQPVQDTKDIMADKIEKETIHAKGFDIGIYTYDFKNEYVSLTDIAKYRSIDPRVTIHNWLRGRDIVEFLGLWESLHNPGFKRIEFDTLRTV